MSLVALGTDKAPAHVAGACCTGVGSITVLGNGTGFDAFHIPAPNNFAISAMVKNVIYSIPPTGPELQVVRPPPIFP